MSTGLPLSIMRPQSTQGRVDQPMGETQGASPNIEHTQPLNSKETGKESHENEFVADQHEMFASEGACTAYLVVLERTYHPSIGRPSEQVYLFVVEALCRAPSKSALVPIAYDLMLKFHPPEITDQFVGALLQREIHLLLTSALTSQDFLKRLFGTGQVCLLAELALESNSTGLSGRVGELLSALFPSSSNSPGPSHPTHRWKTEKDRLFEQYNAMLVEDEGQSIHKYFSVLLPRI